MSELPVTLRVAFQGYTAERIGLQSVFFLPQLRPVGSPYLASSPVRIAHHFDSTLTLQVAGVMVPGRWLDVLRLMPLEMVVE